jgi:pimeloyl-ACP methyl ester carboxylesterase
LKWHCLCLVVTLLFLSLPEHSISAAPQRPVVVIPGILGSNLCKKETGQIIWGGASSLSNLKQLALPLDPSHHTEQFEACGIIESVRVVGPFKIHQYDRLLEMLHSFGYVKEETLFVFAYDWRLSNFATARKLADFVKHNIGERPFDIVAHSMGGIVARIYLTEYDSGSHVNRLVTMGTPHRGSAKVLRVADSGWSWWENILAGGVIQIRETLMTFSSIYQLLPSYTDCCVLGAPDLPSASRMPFSPFSPHFWESLSLLPDQFRTMEGRRFLRQNLEDAEHLHVLLKSPIPGHLKFAPLVAGLVETEWRAYVDPKSGKFVHWDTNFGDGTVYEKSAANMQLFDARPSDVEHQRIFTSDSARQMLRWALLSGVDPTAGRLNRDYRATIAAGPSGIDVTLIELSVIPEVIKAGSSGEFVLRITGKRALAETDFPVNVLLRGLEGEHHLNTITTVIAGDDFSTERTFHATFSAPARIGTYSISATIPGLEPLEELFEVIP